MNDFLSAVWTEARWMLVPFLACLVLSLNHVYLGIHVIARKVIFVDLALAQIAALGAAYALTLGYDPHTDTLQVSLCSLLFTFAGAGVFAIARMRKEKIPQEAFIGIIYAAASAAAILILSKSTTGGEELKQMLVGDVLLVSLPTILKMALLYGAVGVFHFVFRKRFLAISLDPEKAETSGINIRFWDFLFYMSFGVVITQSVAIVGVLLVFSYLVAPAVIAQMWASTVKGKLLLGWLVAILAGLLGIAWSFYRDYPTGPSIVVMLAVFWALSAVIYYVRNATTRMRAAALVAAVIVLGLLLPASLHGLKKVQPKLASTGTDIVGIFLKQLDDENRSLQLDGLKHLQEMNDPRIVPALQDLLARSQSDEVVEATVLALGRLRDPQSLPALRKAAAGIHDYFLKLTIAEAQFSVGDEQGYVTLLDIMRSDDAGYARHQADALFRKQSGRDFGYDPDVPVTDNNSALKMMEDWLMKR